MLLHRREPRTDWLEGVVARDDHGFILAGPDLKDVCGWTLDRPPHHLETSVPGVFVAGDVRAESAKRVAAAVGEGSMAVMLVHRYLAGVVTPQGERHGRDMCLPDELRTLFLFEALSDEQLETLCANGHIATFEPGPDLHRG